MSNPIECVVIGAGPGGLVSTKEILEIGFSDVVCFEKAASIGGTIAKGYDGLHLTSSGAFSMFSDYWIGDDQSHEFWAKSKVIEYWTGYAKHFDVMPRIRFNTTVTSLRQSKNNLWSIDLSNGTSVLAKYVVVATGVNDNASYPNWASKISNVLSIHSREYVNAVPFKDKRVLIVGGGESSSDIALEIAEVAQRTWVSLRNGTGWVVPRIRNNKAADRSTHRGLWNLPRSFGASVSKRIIDFDRAQNDPVLAEVVKFNENLPNEKGIWGTYGTKTIGLPLAIVNYGCKVVSEIVSISDGGKNIETSSGEKIQGLDAIVFCTGYKNYVSFLPEEFRFFNPRELFLQIFPNSSEINLAFVGWARPAFGSQFPIMEIQARYIARIFAGKQSLPSRSERISIAQKDTRYYEAQFENSGRRIESLVDYFRYMGELSARIGCRPPLIRSLIFRPLLWLHLVYGPMQATQFRLVGPGAKSRLSREIIRKLPISSFNHVVIAGIIGRVQSAFKGRSSK